MAYTTNNKSSSNFETTIFTGNGSTQSITGVGFKPDMTWIKNRNATNGNPIYDSLRGAIKRIQTDSTSAQGDKSTGVTSFDSDGFSVGSAGQNNGNTNSMCSWNFLAGGAAPTKTYKVVVVSDSGNKYRFRNSADTATFGASAVTLDLQEGGTYTFDVSDSTLNSHPFVIGTAANGTEYSTGVTYKLDGVTKTYSQYTSGFSAASSRQLIITLAASAPALYYWCSQHSGMGGAINTNATFGSSNFDGAVQSLVSENATAGFSIVKYTGTGSASGTIGHGLGAKPAHVIMRPLTYSGAWWNVNYKLADGQILEFNDNAQANITSFGGGGLKYSTFTTSVIGGANGSSNSDLWNKSGDDYIAYCFANKPGYCQAGQYVGNNNASGPFVYTGFRPKFILFKNAHGGSGSASGYWTIIDEKRTQQFNPSGKGWLYPGKTDSEYDATNYTTDFLSNGFKIRHNGNYQNEDATYVYLAVGQTMVGTNNVPGTAY